MNTSCAVNFSLMGLVVYKSNKNLSESKEFTKLKELISSDFFRHVNEYPLQHCLLSCQRKTMSYIDLM